MDHEKRRYVRVNDTVSLRYRLLDENEVVQSDSFTSAHFGSQLLQIDNKLQVLLSRLKEWNSNVSEALGLLNKKITLISGQVTEVPGGQTAVVLEINLSACGVGFHSQEKAGVDDNVWLELLLQPTHVKVVTTGRVVGCERSDVDPQFPYFLRVDLIGISEEDQESLIQHVIRRESQILKQQRQMRESAANNRDKI